MRERTKEQKQVLRLTTPKLKGVWGPFRKDDGSFYVMDFRDRTLDSGIGSRGMNAPAPSKMRIRATALPHFTKDLRENLGAFALNGLQPVQQSAKARV